MGDVVYAVWRANMKPSPWEHNAVKAYLGLFVIIKFTVQFTAFTELITR